MTTHLRKRGLGCRRELEALEERRMMAFTAELVADWTPGGEGSYPRLLTEWRDDLYLNYGGDAERLSALVDGQVQVVAESRLLEAETSYFATDDYLYITRGGDDIDGPHDLSLMRYDGQTISPVSTCETAGCSSVDGPSDFTFYQGDLYLLAVNEEEWEFEELVRIRGDVAEVVAKLPSSNEVRRSGQNRMVVHNDRLWIGTSLLSSFDGNVIRQEYSTDPPSLPRELTVYDNELYFVTGSTITQNGLMHSHEGKFLQITGSRDFTGAPQGLTVFRDSLVFSASESLAGREPWQYNKLLGLTRLADLDSGDGDSNPAEFTTFQDALYFTADRGGNQRELFRYDQTTIAAVNDLVPSVPLVGTQGLAIFDDQLVFGADDGQHGQELWAFDGTRAHLLADVNPNFLGTRFQEAEQWNGQLMIPLRAQSLEPPVSLWYDGAELSVIPSGILDLPLPPARVIGRTETGLVLSIQTQFPYAGYVLAIYDGIDLTVLPDAPDDVAGATSAVLFEGQLYLGARELWSYDFAAKEYSLRADLLPAGSSNPDRLSVYKDQLYLLARHDLSPANGLWRYDNGRAERLSGDLDVKDYLVYNGDLFYIARSADEDRFAYTVYRFEDGLSRPVAEIPMRFTDWNVHNGILYLAGYDYNFEASTVEQSIWSYNGTQQQIVFNRTLSNVEGDRTGPVELTSWQNDLFFLLDDGSTMELWQYDGQEFSPAFVDSPGASIPRGNADAPWRYLWTLGNQLLMTGDDGTSGEELWRITPARPGDVNGDGRFDSSDLVLVFQAGQYEQAAVAAWREGDWNRDGRFTSADLVFALSQGYDDDSHSWR